MASCSKCGKYFANVRQLGPHRRRCDSQSSVEDSVEGPDDSTTNDSTTSYSSEDSDRSVRSPAAIITQPVNLPPVRLRVIARRTSDWGVQKPLVVTGTTSSISKRDARDLKGASATFAFGFLTFCFLMSRTHSLRCNGCGSNTLHQQRSVAVRVFGWYFPRSWRRAQRAKTEFWVL